LKQARQRASRRFTNDGARSSLPQYRLTTFSVLDVDSDDRSESFGAFAGRAALGAAPTAFFFADATDLPLRVTDTSGADLGSVFTLDLLLGQGLGAPVVVNTHCSVAAMLEANLRLNG
jgi:hypothetical protein